MNRPYIIIHTHTSIDGNINSMDLPEFKAAGKHYRDIAWTRETQKLNINAYLNGKISTQDNITHYQTPDIDEHAAEVPGGDFIVERNASMYCVSIDPRGELAWPKNTLDYAGISAHVIEVLTDAASNGYKDFLRRKEISYVLAGKDQIDYTVMLARLHELGIERLAVTGGGTINWSFVQNGLVDEVSMVLAPIANGDPDEAHFFTARQPYTRVSPVAFNLMSVDHLGDGIVWLRYTVKAD